MVVALTRRAENDAIPYAAGLRKAVTVPLESLPTTTCSASRLLLQFASYSRYISPILDFRHVEELPKLPQINKIMFVRTRDLESASAHGIERGLTDRG